MTASEPPLTLAAILGGAYYLGPSCLSGMPPSDAIAQSLLALPLDPVLRRRVLASVVWGQWLQQSWIRGGFDPNQVPRLRFTGVAVESGIQVSQPARRNRVAVVLPHRPFDELPGR